jgi:hypothetical protein
MDPVACAIVALLDLTNAGRRCKGIMMEIKLLKIDSRKELLGFNNTWTKTVFRI